MLLLLAFGVFPLQASEPFADSHIHFNWDQKEIISAQEVVARMRSNSVSLAVVSSTPSRLALELVDAAGPWVKAFFSPYITVRHRDFWFVDDKVLGEAEQALASGRYAGIGEVHVFASLGPRRDNKILNGLLRLAERFDAPFLIHTEASSHLFFAPICQNYPKVRFLWAHAGSKLKPKSIDLLMRQCPNVWAEVSVRDPWRYHSLVDDEHRLLPGWRELFIKYQDRFMTGTDPVWNVTNDQRWAQADDGWDHYRQLLDFHRNWLKQLPPQVERKVRLDNAWLFFTGALYDPG